MKIKYLSLILLFLPVVASAQSFDDVLESIMANSTEMRAEYASVSAEMAEHKTDLSLEDPEIGFNYLWGSPTDVGTRKDISVTQKLDASVIFGLKKKVAVAQDAVSMGDYDVKRLSYMLNASQLLLRVTYFNRLAELNNTRLSNAKSLNDIYSKMLDAGETNKIEVGKVRLELANVEAESQESSLERQMLLHELKTMNGGKDIEYCSTAYPSSFSFAIGGQDGNASSISSASSCRSEQMVAAAQKETSVAKANNIPELSVGYMAELTRGEKFRGVTVGLSVPLWRNSKSVRSAKARELAVVSQVDDDKLKLGMQIERLRLQVAKLKAMYEGQQKALASVPNIALLRKALDAGELSLVEYLTETNLYYDLNAKLLSSECDYYCALAELQCFE